MPRWIRLAVVAIAAVTVAGCSSDPDRSLEPTAAPSATPSPPSGGSVEAPTVLFNLSEADALDYVEDLIVRAEEALQEGNLGALKDLYTEDGPARREAAAAILRDFRNGWVNDTEIEVERTRIVSIESRLAVFEQVRLVRPCVYDFNNNLVATSDDREMRQAVTVYMADEHLNWRIDREVVRRSEPTGERVACP